MKAAVVRAFDHVPRYETFALPENGEGILVDVLAAALSPRVRSGASGQHYTSNAVVPLVPGIDGVGRLPDGRRVYFLAANDTIGTMAEKALADSKLTVPLPDNVSASVIAAAMDSPAISILGRTDKAREAAARTGCACARPTGLRVNSLFRSPNAWAPDV